MQIRAAIRFICASGVALLAAGCEGGSLTDAGTGSGGGGDDGTTTVSMSLSAGLTTLSAGGSTGLTVNFVDQNGVPFSEEASVTFNSACISAGTAQVTSTTIQPTTTGSVQATYTDQGCGTTDTITATGSANSQTLTASVSIDVLPAAVGSIRFISANPEVIGIRGGGSGLPEQSQLVFQLLNTAGGPAADREVTFTLNNTAGGISFADGTTTATSTSASDGTVGVTVRSGTVLTAVRVTAQFDAGGGQFIETQSSTLVVSTGLADQDSFSLSAENFNVRGFDFDGTTVQVTIRASDRNNNPVPENTAIAFRTEGGDVVSQCLTTADGICTVTWESQNPRPGAHTAGCAPPTNGTDAACAFGLRAGRSTLLATAEGEETFIDLNGNGVFDDGDTFTDLGEAFFDKNENGVRDAAFEEYVEFNGTAGFQATGDGKYNGLQCQHTTLCSAQKTVTVRSSLVIVMSGDGADIFPFGNSTDPDTDISIDDGNSDLIVEFRGPMNANPQLTVSFCAVVRDKRDQPMEVGTVVSLETSLGSVEGTSSDEVLNTTDDDALSNTSCFLLKGPDGTDPDAGTVELKVVTPSGLTQIFPVDATYTP